MSRFGFSIFLLLIMSSSALAQTPVKTIRSREQIWLGYTNQTRFTDKWGGWIDVHYRQTDNFIERPFQFLIRPAITYFIKDNLRAGAGYAFISNFPAKGLNTIRPEHRIWQQIWWNQRYPGVAMLQWLRFEQRFSGKVVNDVLLNDYNFTYRLRYNFSFSVPLKGKSIVAKTPFAVMANEVFINLGKNVVYNTFDQNRFFIGGGYQFTPQLSAQLGYSNIYQQDASGLNYTSAHAVRLFFFHNLDLRNSD
jgi:hypothetical protein